MDNKIKVFHHSAGLGDVIYSLPTVEKMGGGIFVYGQSYKGYEVIKSLVEAQPYIKECKYVSEIDLPKGFINLDLFRNSPLGNKVHLTNLHLSYFEYGFYNWNKSGWLQNIPDSPINEEYMVVNVTPRYRDKIFDKLNLWKPEICGYINKNYNSKTDNKKVYFLGDKSDYEVLKYKLFKGKFNYFKSKFKYLETKDLLEAASIIKGAEIFAGTQSSLLALRQGLGLPYRFEQSPNHVDVNQYSKNETVINPRTRKLHLAIVTTKRLIKGQ